MPKHKNKQTFITPKKVFYALPLLHLPAFSKGHAVKFVRARVRPLSECLKSAAQVYCCQVSHIFYHKNLLLPGVTHFLSQKLTSYTLSHFPSTTQLCRNGDAMIFLSWKSFPSRGFVYNRIFSACLIATCCSSQYARAMFQLPLSN